MQVIHQVYTGFNISSKIKKRLIKRLFTIVPLLGVLSTSLVIPATRSRAALLALVIAGFALLAIKYRNYLKLLKNSSKPKKYLSLLFFTIICSAIFFKGYQYKQASANGRLLIWKISKNIIVDNPFFGVGFDNFKAHYMNYQANYFSENKNSAEIAIAGNSKYAFNEFVQVTVENGIIGFAVFLFLVYLIFSLKLKHNQLFLGYLIRILILTITVFAFFSYPTQILPIKILLVVSLAYVASLDANKIFLLLRQQKYAQVLFKAALLISSVVLLYISSVRITALASGFKIWKEAQYSFKNSLFNISIDEYESTLHVFLSNGEFLGDYG